MSETLFCSEKYIESKLKDLIKARGGLCIKMSPFGVSGFPDRIILMPGGRVFFLELKSKGKKPRRLQRYWLDKLSRLGFPSAYIDYYPDLENYIETKIDAN